jgi:Tol biopolymer transport system component
LSETGTLVYVPGGGEPARRTLVSVDRKGNAQPLQAPAHSYSDVRVSPDGRRLAVEIQSAQRDLWIYELARHTLTRFTFQHNNMLPVWTPDGKRVIFCVARPGAIDVLSAAADGSGAVQQLATGPQIRNPSSCSPDGKVLAYVEFDPARKYDIWMLPLEGDRKPRPFLQTPFNETAPEFSPDGRWLAYQSDESGRFEIYVQAFPGPGGKVPVSADGGTRPRWSSKGQELFYRNGGKMMAVGVQAGLSFRAGTPRVLFEGRYGNQYDVMPDGQRFITIESSEPNRAAGTGHRGAELV